MISYHRGNRLEVEPHGKGELEAHSLHLIVGMQQCHCVFMPEGSRQAELLAINIGSAAQRAFAVRLRTRSCSSCPASTSPALGGGASSMSTSPVLGLPRA